MTTNSKAIQAMEHKQVVNMDAGRVGNANDKKAKNLFWRTMHLIEKVVIVDTGQKPPLIL